MFKNLIKYLQKHKILLALSFLSIISLIFIYTFTSHNQTNPDFVSLQPTSTPLKVSNVYPSGDFIAVFPSTALTITFNQKITLSQVHIEITPSIKLNLTLSPDQTLLIATPLTTWSYKTYSVKIVGPSGISLTEYKISFLDPSKTPSNGGDH